MIVSKNKIIFNYSGNVTGDEPATMVCKISAAAPRNINILWRMFVFAQSGNWDEYMCRQEILFFQNVIPLLKDTAHCTPKCYFIGKPVSK